MSKRKLFWSGFVKTLPYQGGVIPFGVLYATIATNQGFPWWLVQLFSLIVFGGSSQLMFIDLLNQLGSPYQAVLGSNIVNARHFIYSAGVSRTFQDFPLRWKILLSYWLTDQLYAISIAFKDEIKSYPKNIKHWFFIGSAVVTSTTWFASSGLGILFGQLIPESWNLSFSIPLMFMPLVCTVCRDRFAWMTALLSASFIVLLQKMPLGLGVLFSILLATTMGYWIERKFKRKIRS